MCWSDDFSCDAQLSSPLLSLTHSGWNFLLAKPPHRDKVSSIEGDSTSLFFNSFKKALCSYQCYTCSTLSQTSMMESIIAIFNDSNQLYDVMNRNGGSSLVCTGKAIILQ